MLRHSEVDIIDTSRIAIIAVSLYLTMNDNSKPIGNTSPKHRSSVDPNSWKLQGRYNVMHNFGRRPPKFSQTIHTAYKLRGIARQKS
jgi:hypothetical protein